MISSRKGCYHDGKYPAHLFIRIILNYEYHDYKLLREFSIFTTIFTQIDNWHKTRQWIMIIETVVQDDLHHSSSD